MAFGPGGVFVEATARIGGLLAPFRRREAVALIDDFRDIKIFHGFRGRSAWDLDALADILVRAGDFAAGSSHWLSSLDINPIVWTGSSFRIVDALMLVRSEGDDRDKK
jgi:hypothetical protein